ncbi:antibiotic biosynthesis monooxygenase [Methylobrevis albus]|uniref:Antibiotic biosynthesis monooxygenase n=1 Tax=Methylobrevis albus TaxID=2793297 RepID=A0A931HYZ7_9HYPH|nr:antibiotic biosynthesis monooxygenase [Methylobrevis albus]MBH0236667.1 antibiotic biosynthesis monooxygenase [Methylobrevis albus]
MSLAALIAAAGPAEANPADRSGAIFRVDRFSGPAAARAELLSVVQRTHRLLGGLDGCLVNLVLEREAPDGGFVLETIAGWRDGAALAGARVAVATLHRAAGIDPPALIRRLGVVADFGLWRALDEGEGMVE